jgi:hypothetical protein
MRSGVEISIPSDLRVISINAGFLMLAGFISLFLLIHAMGLGYRSELRFSNGVIHAFCLYWAIRAYLKVHPENKNEYMWGIAQGIGASVIGVGGFTIFMALFLVLNPALMNTIRQNSEMGLYLNPVTASLYILAEGVFIGLIGSYILTRILGITLKERKNSAV